MIIKLLGMMVILFSSVAMGFRMADNMASRESELRNLSDAVTLMLGELDYTHLSIKDIFVKVMPFVKGEVDELFRNICTELEKGESASCAWADAVVKSAQFLPFKASDCAILEKSGYLLEAYGLEEQKTNLNALKQRVDSLVCDAEEFKKKNSRIARMLGIYGGLLLCIIVF